MQLVILIGPNAQCRKQIQEKYYATYELIHPETIATHFEEQFQMDENMRYRIHSNVQSNLDTIIDAPNLSYYDRKKLIEWGAGAQSIVAEMVVSSYNDENLDNFRVPVLWEGFTAINWRYCDISVSLMALTSLLARSQTKISGKPLQEYSNNLAQVCPAPELKTACLFLNLGRTLDKQKYEGYSAYLLLSTALDSEFLEFCAQLISWAHANLEFFPAMDETFKQNILTIRESEERL